MTNKLNEINALLELFYRGETSPEQQQRLHRLMAELGPELPSELRADAAVVEALCGNVDVPADCSEQVAEMIRLTAAASGRRSAMHRLWSRVAAAVSVGAVAACVVVALVRNAPADDLTGPSPLADSSAALLSENIHPAPVPAPAPAIEPQAPAAEVPAPAPAPAQLRRSPARAVEPAEEPDAVTDPEEARALLAHVSNVLAQAREVRAEAAADADRSVNHAFNTINSILQ
jgi:hypothetical protein